MKNPIKITLCESNLFSLSNAVIDLQMHLHHSYVRYKKDKVWQNQFFASEIGVFKFLESSSEWYWDE